MHNLNERLTIVNPTLLIMWLPCTATDKITKQQPKLEGLKVCAAPRETSCLHGNPPIPKIRSPRSLLHPSTRETGSGGPKTRQQQQERLNTKYNTALLSSVLRLFFLFHRLSESAEPPAVARKHLSRVKFIPRVVHAGCPTRLSGAGL